MPLPLGRGGEGAVLAVANAVQLGALGVEHSQKRARQARNLDGPGPWKTLKSLDVGILWQSWSLASLAGRCEAR